MKYILPNIFFLTFHRPVIEEAAYKWAQEKVTRYHSMESIIPEEY